MKDWITASILVAIVIGAGISMQSKTTYSSATQDYYDIEYHNTEDGIDFKINNPCVKIKRATGNSMKPFWDYEELNIIDTCFPFEKLEVGDVIVFKREFERNKYVNHRIIEINYGDKWVRTQGDNNDIRDDIKSHEYIYGKVIGFLNVIDDKKEVPKPEPENETLPILGNASFFVVGNITFIVPICTNTTTHWTENNQTCVGIPCLGYFRICLTNDYWREIAKVLEEAENDR